MFLSKVKNLLDAKRAISEEKENKPFEEKDLLEKIEYCLLYPFQIARKLTILPCEEEHYDKYQTYIWPFTGVLFLVWAIQPTPSMLWV